MPKLALSEPQGTTRIFEWDEDELAIGRAAYPGLTLEDHCASRMHARINRESGRYIIRDLNSGNGLYVNSARVKEHKLKNGDLIQIGRCQLTFEDLGSKNAVCFSEVDTDEAPIAIRRIEEVTGFYAVPPAERQGALAIEAEVKALRKKARILMLMYELGKTLQGAVCLEDVYRHVCDLLLEVCSPDRVLILEREGENELKIAYRVDRAEGVITIARTETVSRTITTKVMSERITLLSSNAAGDPLLAEGKSVILHQIRSVICAPLLVRNDVKGVIYIDGGKVAAFTPTDLDVVNAVAAQTAVTLENVHALARLTREAEARAAYSRFLPPHVVEDLLQRPERIQLGGANQTATVLFADIRGFTRLAAQLEPERVVAMLNEYFGEMTELIFEHGGTLDKYMGDGLMALFGAPYAGPDDAINAVRCAMAMQKRLEVLKEQFKSKEGNWQDVRIGIGISTGVVTVGYVGSTRRLDYTAIGDTVNMAARLESMAPAGAIYVTRATYQALRGEYCCRELEVKVKGRDQPMPCYQVLWDPEAV